MENNDNLNSEQLDEVSGGIDLPMPEKPRCSRCLSYDLTYQTTTQWYLGYTVIIYKCNNCGAEVRQAVKQIQN